MIRPLLFLALISASHPALAETFPQEDQKAYLDACLQGNNKLNEYCNCTLKQLQKYMTTEEYKALSKKSEQEVIDDVKFNASISACSYTFR